MQNVSVCTKCHIYSLRRTHMAGYNNQGNGNRGNYGSKPSYAGNAVDKKQTDAEKGIVFSTGLFKPEKGMAVGSIKIKETITLPAGSYLNLYQNEPKSPKSPVYRIQVKTVQKKA